MSKDDSRDLLSGKADVQSEPDFRKIPIDKVGVKGIQYPITVLDKNRGTQDTIAQVNMYVSLPHQFRGTHMSRFIEILNDYRSQIKIEAIPNILRAMKSKLNAESAHLKFKFPYFMTKKAPVSGEPGKMSYNCTIHGFANSETTIGVEVEVPITTLCPCSKEISSNGAHNQRGIVRLSVKFKKLIWIEDLIELVESCASCEVYSLLKRVDEKYVTEKAYNNPMFVEDVVRTVADRLWRDHNITWFSVESESIESIHNHNAYAYVERTRQEDK